MSGTLIIDDTAYNNVCASFECAQAMIEAIIDNGDSNEMSSLTRALRIVMEKIKADAEALEKFPQPE